MIEQLQTKIDQNNITNIKARVVDIVTEKLNSREYDLIYTSMVLYHIVGIQEVLSCFYDLC